MLDDASKARTVYTELGSGIEIVDDVKNFPSARLAEIPALESEASCELSPQLAGMGGTPAGYDEGRINVYYVKKFAWGTGSPAGVDCAYISPPHQEIILLDGTMSTSPVVLAHELGHALGLLRSVPLPGGGGTASSGHVNDLQLEPYLGTGNLMRSGGAYVGADLARTDLPDALRQAVMALAWEVAWKRLSQRVPEQSREGRPLPTVDHSSITRLAMRRLLAWSLAVVILVMAVLLYRQSHPEWPKPLNDFEMTQAWLQGFDCQEGFFDRLSRMPAKNKDSVTRLLSVALLLGPDSTHLARFNQELLKTWVADSVNRASRGETRKYEVNSYLARYQRGYDATWRRRAAIALGIIRTDSALAALDLALKQLPLETAVDSVLHQTLERARSDSGVIVR